MRYLELVLNKALRHRPLAHPFAFALSTSQ